MVGASTVFSGQDNSGQAAIVNSTQDNSFALNMLNAIAREAADKKRKADEGEKQKKAFLTDISVQYDPFAVEELDKELADSVNALEDYATEAYAAGLDPSDPTTEAGKEYLQMKRKIDMRNITGKSGADAYKSALKALDEEGIDPKYTLNWLKGYRDAKPKENESVADAKARYVSENPTAVKKLTGMFDYVAPILENINYAVNTKGDKTVDPVEVGRLIDAQLLTPQGQMLFEQMSPNKDWEKFRQDQIDLVMAAFPVQKGKEVKASSGGSGGSGGSGSSDYSFEITRSENPNMFKSGDSSVNNGILLSNKSGGELPVQDIKLPDGKVVSGTPLAITKDKDGNLFLEYSYKEGGDSPFGSNSEVKKGYIPYGMFRDRIEAMYGEDISLKLNEGVSEKSAAPTKMNVPQGGRSR